MTRRPEPHAADIVRRRRWIALALAATLVAPALAAQLPRLADARSGHATGGIVFVGSSIFHRWTRLESQMAPLPITNIAFDGSVTADMLRMVDSRVIPLRPKVIAYYCGSNDVSLGETAAAIVGRIVRFVERVSAALPDTRVVFVSINRAPSKEDRWDVVDDVNRQIKMYATSHPHVEYVDVNPVLFDANGKPRSDLYMGDELHLRPPAYEGFAEILKPVLTRALGE
jgi:lysophospholipase L1-like esterase